eukprot:TRINITY_DN556_c0_g1_i1.p3 TRINITY_DN556_c0_g1~~TRINITY_DN556_c0_g1_i1.p3  ORF type:complete len:107 (-),score=1.75 TRINITY_DN556_c0_g1_i1:197-517(-)
MKFSLVAIVCVFATLCNTAFADFPCLVTVGIDQNGADLGNEIVGRAVSFKTHSFKDCAIACGLNKECDLYTYNIENSFCFLKVRVGFTLIDNSNAISGGPCLAASL